MVEAIYRKQNYKIQWPKSDATTHKEEKRIEITSFSFFFQGQPGEEEG
jgi:hypothetical protein